MMFPRASVFITFMDDLDDMTKCTLRKVADNKNSEEWLMVMLPSERPQHAGK